MKNLTKLTNKSIDLSVNKIEELPEFQYNIKLEFILIDINQIKKFNLNLFSSLKELKCLAFNSLKKLESLTLYGNKLTNKNVNYFEDLNTNCKIYLEYTLIENNLMAKISCFPSPST